VIPEQIYINPPKVLRPLFGRAHWETKNNEILFTFDDGPVYPATEVILNALESHKIQGLFFVNGDSDRGLMKEIHAAGHVLGNHLFTHKYYTGLNWKVLFESIAKTNDIISNITGKKTDYFRPTYGRPFLGINSMTSGLGLETVMWSLLIWDFKYSTQRVTSIIQSYIKPDSIIVFHNNNQVPGNMREMISYTVAEISKRGYRCGKVTECLK